MCRYLPGIGAPLIRDSPFPNAALPYKANSRDVAIRRIDDIKLPTLPQPRDGGAPAQAIGAARAVQDCQPTSPHERPSANASRHELRMVGAASRSRAPHQNTA